MGCLVDIAGQKFGRVTAVRHDGFFDKKRQALWLCLCDCGTLFEAAGCVLRNGNTQSCGCLHRERAATLNFKHGHTADRQLSPTFVSWQAMLQRCSDLNSSRYRFYGAKGVQVCERWKTFTNFLADMGERPTAGHVLSRRDDAGNYEPGNVAWKLQAVNLKEMHERRSRSH